MKKSITRGQLNPKIIFIFLIPFSLIGFTSKRCKNVDVALLDTTISIADRVVVLPAQTYLTCDKIDSNNSVSWDVVSGPGEVIIANKSAKNTSAKFVKPGDYVLKFTVNKLNKNYSTTFKAHVVLPETKSHLIPIPLSTYKINSVFWNERIKMQIVNWIPHCIKQLEDTAKGIGIQNFMEARHKLAGRPYQYVKTINHGLILMHLNY